MKVISLYQPWASLIAWGHKTIETRGWGTPYRGSLLIHAGKRCDAGTLSALFHLQAALSGFGRERMPEPLPLGKVVALAMLADCRRMDVAPDPLNEMFGNFGPGRYGWVLTDVRRLESPISLRGQQGIFDAPDELEKRVLDALAAEART